MRGDVASNLKQWRLMYYDIRSLGGEGDKNRAYVMYRAHN